MKLSKTMWNQESYSIHSPLETHKLLSNSVEDLGKSSIRT